MTESPTAALCVNCSQPVHTTFCPQCGQRNPPKKITLLNMYYDFQSRVYGFDGMLPRTLRDLTLRPGTVAERFIKGNRVLYYGPVGYFFLMATVYLIIMSLLGINFQHLMEASQMAGTEQNSRQLALQQHISSLMQDNMRILFFLTVPAMALWSRILFRKTGLNFLEHSVLPFYTSGHFYWISILSLFLIKWNKEFYIPGVFIALQAIYYGFALQDFFRYQSKTKTFFKGLLVFLLGTLTFAIAVGVASVVFMVLNPGTRKILESNG